MSALATAPNDAFAVRQQHFPDEINFHAPGLKRYRTSGQQKVIVEHVTVNEGGLAIVGAVTQGGRG